MRRRQEPGYQDLCFWDWDLGNRAGNVSHMNTLTTEDQTNSFSSARRRPWWHHLEVCHSVNQEIPKGWHEEASLFSFLNFVPKLFSCFFHLDNRTSHVVNRKLNVCHTYRASPVTRLIWIATNIGKTLSLCRVVCQTLVPMETEKQLTHLNAFFAV